MEERISTKKAAVYVMAATLISKILGFFREILLGSRYGATYVTDAYLISMTIPLVLFSSVAAAISTTYIPVYSDVRLSRGKSQAVNFTNKLLNIIVLASMILAVLGMIFTKPIVSVIAMGFKGQTLELAVKLTRITFPMIVFIGAANVYIGFLQSNNEFAVPALTGIPYNVFIIIMLLFSDAAGIYGLVYGTVAGVAMQVVVQIPSLKKKGYRYSSLLSLRDPYVKKVLVLALPVMMGMAVQQLNALVDRMLASGLPEGSISALNFANRLNAFVYGVFSSSISIVVYPLLSKLNAEKDMDSFKKTLVNGLNVITLLLVPITVGAVVLRQPIVSVLFERGQFDERATVMTASALMFYSLGIVFYGFRDILNRTFYSLHDTKTPMLNGIVAVAVNIVLNLILIRYMQHSGLALATSISSAAMTFLMFASLKKRLGSIGWKNVLLVFIKSAAASAVMGLIVYVLNNFAASRFASTSRIIGFVTLGLIIVIGMLVYFALIYAFKVEELGWISQIIRNYVKAKGRQR
ncbi:MAG: murein biosynthesis integral membrane protein MurJ [Clostridiales bacterium]|jgi:putative peptidoglycan lipid II flippase|nr:murein biosynthesis integral membrane protein MurJ [Clostridiales bacterium]